MTTTIVSENPAMIMMSNITIDVFSTLQTVDMTGIAHSIVFSLTVLVLGSLFLIYMYLMVVVMQTDHTLVSLLKMNTSVGGNGSCPPVAPFGMFECIYNMTSDQQPWFPLRARKALNDTDTFVLPLPRRPVMTGDFALAREILTDPLSVKPKVYREFETLGVGSIFTRNGTFWHVRRKGAAMAFSNHHVRRMNQVALEITEKWIQDVLIPCTKEGKSFDPSKEMISITLEAICKTAFEYDISEEEKEAFVSNLKLSLNEFLTKSINNPLRKFLGTWLPDRRRALEAAKANAAFAKKIIANYRANPNPLKGTIIDCLVNNPCYKSDDELAADVNMFLIAGHDTTAYSVAFALLELARNKDEQTKVREDLWRVEREDNNIDIDITTNNNNNNNSAECENNGPQHERRNSTSKCITDTWKKSDALHMAIKESMRLYPVSASGSSRVCGREFVTKEGWIIPKGTSVVSHIMMTHRNKTVFGANADEFVPSRWIKPTQDQKDSLLSFSAGKQNCVGQSLAKAEVHCIVPRILSEVELEVEDEGAITWFMTLKPIGARLKPRFISKEQRSKVTMR